MGTTTNFDLPYPEGGDLVIDGDDAIQELAERIDTILVPDVFTVTPADSPQAVGGTTDVQYAGTATYGGFTFDGTFVTYTGDAARYFMVSVMVSIDQGGTNIETIESGVNLLNNGGLIGVSTDKVASVVSAVGSLQLRTVTHNITVPVQLSPGDTISASASASPAGSLGLTALRIYPIGPKL